MNTIERTFTINLFRAPRELTARAVRTNEGPSKTRFFVPNVIAIAYLTGRKIHIADIQIETDPAEVEHLVRTQDWRQGDGFAFYIDCIRKHGRSYSRLCPVGWLDQFPREDWA
jgi:hypothetical protein